MQKLPYILVMGDKEKAASTVVVRARGDADFGVMPADDFIVKIVADIAAKAQLPSHFLTIFGLQPK